MGLTEHSDANAYEVTSSFSSMSNSTEFNLDAFLKSHLGSRSREFPESLTLTVVYALIFVTGLLGNACTCVVIVTNGHLHTATNFYLFSLAISDLLTLILGQYYNTHILLHYYRKHAVITAILELPGIFRTRSVMAFMLM